MMAILETNETFLKTIHKNDIRQNRIALGIDDRKLRIAYGSNLFVSSASRKKGICKAFLGELLKTVKADYFITDINDQNIPSIKCHLYNKFVKKVPSFYHDSSVYVRRL
jgi:hypothetical protein